MDNLEVMIKCEKDPGWSGSEFISAIILYAIRSFWGQVGASQLQYEITQVNEDTNYAKLEVSHEDKQRVWAALTMLGSFQNIRCRLYVRETM
jgi:RNase P/RNase MRP subunit POP5